MTLLAKLKKCHRKSGVCRQRVIPIGSECGLRAKNNPHLAGYRKEWCDAYTPARFSRPAISGELDLTCFDLFWKLRASWTSSMFFAMYAMAW